MQDLLSSLMQMNAIRELIFHRQRVSDGLLLTITATGNHKKKINIKGREIRSANFSIGSQCIKASPACRSFCRNRSKARRAVFYVSNVKFKTYSCHKK